MALSRDGFFFALAALDYGIGKSRAGMYAIDIPACLARAADGLDHGCCAE